MLRFNMIHIILAEMISVHRSAMYILQCTLHELAALNTDLEMSGGQNGNLVGREDFDNDMTSRMLVKTSKVSVSVCG